MPESNIALASELIPELIKLTLELSSKLIEELIFESSPELIPGLRFKSHRSSLRVEFGVESRVDH